MVETWHRMVGQVLRVGDKDVVVNICEEYTAENPGIPVRVRMSTASGLITEGPIASAWREMLELLGIAAPLALPAIAESAEPEKSRSNPPSEFAPQPATSLPEVLPPAVASAPALAPPSAEEHESPRDRQEEEEYVEPEEERPMNRNIIQESLIKLLNSPVESEDQDEDDCEYSDEPPPEITEQDVAGIPNLPTSADAAAFIEDVERNIELVEMRADAAARAEKLEYLKKANVSKRCEHVKLNGETCGSPAVRAERFCHFHGKAHAPSIEIPMIEDQRSLQVAFTQLAQQVASNKIDAAQARLLLQILETAGRVLQAEGA